MSKVIAVLDACVLYPAPIRDLLMHLALLDVFKARWTERIHDEWIRNLLENRPDLTREKLERTRGLMNANVRGCLVEDYEHAIETFDLPDPDGRHVLAAAVAANADYIVTFNLKDFPREKTRPFGVSAIHPDKFLVSLLDSDVESVLLAIKRQQGNLKSPPLTLERLLDILREVGLPKSTSMLKAAFGLAS